MTIPGRVGLARLPPTANHENSTFKVGFSWYNGGHEERFHARILGGCRAAIARCAVTALLGRGRPARPRWPGGWLKAGGTATTSTWRTPTTCAPGKRQVVLGSLERSGSDDEVQRRPELFPILRVLVDRPDVPTRFWCWAALRPDLCVRPPSRWRGGSSSSNFTGSGWTRPARVRGGGCGCAAAFRGPIGALR